MSVGLAPSVKWDKGPENSESSKRQVAGLTALMGWKTMTPALAVDPRAPCLDQGLAAL